jgi:hypothetical protein
MAYLGRNLANLSDRVVLDSLTASATASYTLQLNSVNFVPSSAESLTVSLNGVIQAPISSYTVSGSTLTFASALTSSDSIDFIIAERGITLQTPSAGSVGTSQLASTAVTTAKIADDAVTKDKVLNLMYPAFEAYLSADQDITESVDTKVQFDTEVFDTDNCYDNTTNYRFTPTVAGKYFVYLFIRGDSKDVSKLDFLFSRLYKNGSIYRESLIDLRNNFGRQATTSISTVVNMNGTTDYLEGFLRVDTQATTPKAESNNNSCYFGAYRIGD